jgi:hypothetical protein
VVALAIAVVVASDSIFLAQSRQRPLTEFSHSLLKIVVDKKAAIVVGFKPVVQVNLVQIRGDDFLAEFVGFRAQERNVQSGEDSDQGLHNAVGVNVGMSIRRLHLAECG